MMTVKILAHRGYWKTKAEQNTIDSFKQALDRGYGIETDIWATDCGPVLSHDIPRFKSPRLNDLLTLGVGTTLALNVKSSGLQSVIEPTSLKGVDYFFFDGSVPDSLKLIEAGFKVYTRRSAYEVVEAFYPQANGVWVDCFNDETRNVIELKGHSEVGKELAFVSPELHGRDPLSYWKFLRGLEIDF